MKDKKMTDKIIREMIEDGEIEQVPKGLLQSYLDRRTEISGLPTNAIKYLIYHGMIEKVPKEDLQLMQENLKAREHFSPEGINELYKSICFQAVEDYKAVRVAMTYRNMSRTVRENIEKRKKAIEEFFESDFFLHNAGVPSKDYVIKAIERQMKRKAQLSLVT